MTTLLHLDSSALGDNSATRELTAAIFEALPEHGRVHYRDLDRDPVAHLTGAVLGGADVAASADGEKVMAQFLEADTIVIGAPMYNFSIPSTLKAWIDRIAVAGKTFRYSAAGPEGLAGGKRVIIASARGGAPAQATDFQETYLRQLFGFLGVTDITFVRAEGLAMSPEARATAMATALRQADELGTEEGILATA